jgi:hypothetical protein
MKLIAPAIILVILANIGFTLYFFVFNKQNDTILVVESYNLEYEWDQSYKQGLEEKLGNDYRLEFFQMDTKRIPESEYESRAAQAYGLFEKLQPALVILGDDNALKYLGPKMVKTDVPVVYLGINNDPIAYLGKPAMNITGVLERPLLERSIYSLTKLLGPELKKVLVLFDSETTSKVSLEYVFQGRNQINLSGIRVDLKLIGDWKNWRETVLTAREAGYDALIVGLYQRIFDDTGKHVDSELVLSWTDKNTPIPHFGFWDFSVGIDKTIGGLVLYGKQQGLAAGDMALRILTFDKKPHEITPKIAERGRYLFSKSQLAKFQLTLPKEIAFEAAYVE